MTRDLTELVATLETWRPDHVALSRFDDEGRLIDELSRRELANAARALVHRLHELDVPSGTIIAAELSEPATMAIAVCAAALGGYTLLPLNLRLTPNERSEQIQRAAAAARLHDGPSQSMAVAALPTPSPRQIPEASWVLYTSGTTGRPRAALLSGRAVLASSRASSAVLGPGSDARWLAVMPLYHVGGLSILVRTLLDGGTMQTLPRFSTPAVARVLRESGTTRISLVPTMLARLVADDVPPAALDTALIGGAAAAPELLRTAAHAGWPVRATWGCTEAASQITTMPAPPHDLDWSLAGSPLPGIQIRIDAPDAQGAGEIVVNGPTLMDGYLDDPAASVRALRDGELHTGDMGIIDASGYLRVLDRRADLIVSGGENVYPAEVEAALLGHPNVQSAAVVGLPDPEWGHIVAAVVVLARSPQTTDPSPLTTLESWLRTRLAAYKIPRRWTLADRLPTTSTGKIQRQRVRKDFF